MPKVAINIRADPGVLRHFRATGPGWQSRITAKLRKAIGLRPSYLARSSRRRILNLLSFHSHRAHDEGFMPA